MQLKWGIRPLYCPPPQKLKCCLLCPRCPVASLSAHVAQLTKEGSSSCGWASGTAEASFFPRMWLLMRHGSTTTTTASAWASFFWRSTVPRSQPKSWCDRTCMPCNSGAQRVTLGFWGEASFSPHGGTGPSVSRTWASRVVLSGDTGRAWGWLDAGPFVDGWTPKMQATCGLSLHRLWRPNVATMLGLGLCAECFSWRHNCIHYSLWGETEDAVC